MKSVSLSSDGFQIEEEDAEENRERQEAGGRSLQAPRSLRPPDRPPRNPEPPPVQPGKKKKKKTNSQKTFRTHIKRNTGKIHFLNQEPRSPRNGPSSKGSKTMNNRCSGEARGAAREGGWGEEGGGKGGVGQPGTRLTRTSGAHTLLTEEPAFHPRLEEARPPSEQMPGTGDSLCEGRKAEGGPSWPFNSQSRPGLCFREGGEERWWWWWGQGHG